MAADMEGFRQPEALPQRTADQTVLLEETGRAPVPFWWPTPDRAPMIAGRRPSVPHAAYAAAALEAPADSSSAVPKQYDTYVHWLYAQNLGYQGFRMTLDDRHSIILTTPPPAQQHLARMIAGSTMTLPVQQELFDLLEDVLTGFERVPIDSPAAQGALQEEAPQAKTPKKRRFASRKPGKVTWKPKEEERASPGGKGASSLQLLHDMYEGGQLTEKQYAEATRAVRKTIKEAARRASALAEGASAEPEPEPEPAAEPDESAAPAPEEDEDVAEEVRVIEEPEAELDVDPPTVSISDALSLGVVFDLLPYQCEFETAAAEFSFDLGALVKDYEGDALFCVLRRDASSGSGGDGDGDDEGEGESAGSEASVWAPLDSNEGVSLSETGLVTVELRSFCTIMVVWMASLHPWHTQAMVEMLADGILVSMESRGRAVDAAYRTAFRLGSVVPLQIGRNEAGARWVFQLPELHATMQSKVSTAVFADSERREAEAAAAAEALRLEQEAAAAAEARIAALPLMLHAACKKGSAGWMGDKDANPEGISIEGILAEGTDLHLWTDATGYTALYVATMYVT